MLEDASAVDFHLLNKVLNVSLHDMPVRFDGVERDFMFASPRVAGAAAGLRHMPHGRWRPAIGGRPHRRPTRRRVSPAPFFLTDCGRLLVSWVGFLSDVIGGVESTLWEGCYPH